MSNENQAPAVQDGNPATQIPAGVETAAVPETNVDAEAAEVAAEAAKVVEAVAGEAEAPKESRERNEQANGVVRPSPDTKTGAVWRIADEMTKQLGHPAKRKDVLAESAALGIVETTAATQYGRWRKFNGLEGRGDDVDVAAKPAKQTKAEKAVEKAAEKAAAEAAALAAVYAPTAKVIEE